MAFFQEIMKEGQTGNSNTSILYPSFTMQGITPTGSQALKAQGATSATTTQPNIGLGDITKAQEGAELLKSRYIDQDPYAKYLEGAKTGTMAMLGRQSELDRTQLEAGLQKMGSGVNALRRTGARANLNTELAYRYMGAEKGLAELGMASAERAQGALNDYIGAYLNIAGRQQGAYQSYWQRYSSGTGGRVTVGGRNTDPRNKNVNKMGFGGGMKDPAGAGLLNRGNGTGNSVYAPATASDYSGWTGNMSQSELQNKYSGDFDK